MTTIGLRCEGDVLSLATHLGIQVSQPFGGQARYDQVWDVNGKLLKIQIKACQEIYEGAAITFSCQPNNKKYEENEIDAIVTCHNEKIYYLSFEEINKSSKKTLYFNLNKETALKSNIKQINWASDYELTIEKLNTL